MIYKQYVQEALKRSNVFENNGGSHSGNPALDQSSLISRLIHDIFGGEILKTLKWRRLAFLQPGQWGEY
jgi:hypothetical protein